MDNHANRFLQDLEITGEALLHFRVVLSMKTLPHSRIAVAYVESLGPTPGPRPRDIRVGDGASEVEIMKNDNTRHRVKEIPHVLMKARVAEVVKHSVISIAVVLEPLHSSYRANGLDPWV